MQVPKLAQGLGYKRHNVYQEVNFLMLTYSQTLVWLGRLRKG